MGPVRYSLVVQVLQGRVGLEPFSEAHGGQSEFHGVEWEPRQWSAWVAVALEVFAQVEVG